MQMLHRPCPKRKQHPSGGILMKKHYHFENHWREARKMKNLRDALFALTSLSMEIGCEEYDSLRYNRCFDLKLALEDKIVEKWGHKK